MASGAGQTAAEISLSPGKQTLQLILGDKDHVPHNPPIMSEIITVTVVAVDFGTGCPRGSITVTARC